MAVLALIDMSSTYVVGTQVNGRVYIKIINPATGQLTNGNNIAISYQVNNNGILKNYTINIAGQSQAIYTGKISDSDPLNPYYTSFLIQAKAKRSNMKIRHMAATFPSQAWKSASQSRHPARQMLS